MPLPSARSRLASALAKATGLSTQWVYTCLKAGSVPYDADTAKIWRRVVAREARREAKRTPVAPAPSAGLFSAGVRASSSCVKPTRTPVRSPGQVAK